MSVDKNQQSLKQRDRDNHQEVFVCTFVYLFVCLFGGMSGGRFDLDYVYICCDFFFKYISTSSYAYPPFSGVNVHVHASGFF